MFRQKGKPFHILVIFIINNIETIVSKARVCVIKSHSNMGTNEPLNSSTQVAGEESDNFRESLSYIIRTCIAKRTNKQTNKIKANKNLCIR